MASRGWDIHKPNIENPSQSDLVNLGAETLAGVIADAVRNDARLARVLRARLGSQEQPDASAADGAPGTDEPSMVGASGSMRRVFDVIRRFANTDAPVLITGESGTGKELAALAIHERSHYASGPFVPINCAGLPPTLITSELFGHEKGAFTGAHQRRVGRLQSAEGGTVLLDEIGDMPLEVQPHLLRFLQEFTVDRIGGRGPIHINVRVVAATNKDLAAEVKAERFRKDLFYRLNVLSFEMPPLRDRGGDIELLSVFFLKQFSTEIGGRVHGFTEVAQSAMLDYAWPGNIREMISRIRRAVLMAEDELITVADLDLDEGAPPTAPRYADGSEDLVLQTNFEGSLPTLTEARNRVEEALLRIALHRNARNISTTAEELGVSRVTLYRLLDKFGMRPGDSLETH